jgi:hypothetical protein
MYRDDSTHVDEHDRAVGAIQIADGLIADCGRASKRLASAEHRWTAAREIQDDYAEIWRQLDSARRILVARGANTIGFDELRERVVRVLAVRDDGVDTQPLGEARRAVEELRLAIPGADWTAIEARTKGLAGTTFTRKGQHIAFAGVALVFTLAVATWAASTVPEPQLDPRVAQRLEMKAELAEVVVERKERIEQLVLLIGGRCDRPNVMEYMKLLVMDGQWEEAYGYGEDYKYRCGEDPAIEKWARVAKKKIDRLTAR